MDYQFAKRSGHVLNSKLRKYLIPTIATALALSLDEFVDSIIVANMLGLESMTVVNVASPVNMIIAATYLLFGIGGSTIYALNVGRRDTKTAGKSFTVSMVSSLFIAIMFCVLGNIFIEPFCRTLCSDAKILEELVPFVRVQLFTAPIIIGIQTLSGFLPAAGNPNFATVLCMIANATNLVGDYVFIRLGFGVKGTAFATLSGYLICLVVLIILLIARKIRMFVTLPEIKDFKMIRKIVGQGGTNALTQIGYSVKVLFFNNIALSIGGSVALKVFALCMQVISIMSIALGGITDAVVPFIATLKGQKDATGVKIILRSGIIILTAISGVLVILFELFPNLLYMMFSVTDPEVINMATGAIRVFLPMFILRNIYIVFIHYARIIGHQFYSMIIGLLDGFALLIPVALICSSILGTYGLWVSFPVTSILLLLGVFAVNLILARRSNGRLYGLFLQEREEDVDICDMTISEENESISQMSEGLTAFCKEHGVKDSIAVKIGLIAEEMAVYTRSHRKKKEQIDIMARISPEDITLDFRSLGTPFDPLAKSDEDNDENIQLINKIPSNIEYDYILGMNSTRFTMNR